MTLQVGEIVFPINFAAGFTYVCYILMHGKIAAYSPRPIPLYALSLTLRCQIRQGV